MADPDDRLVRRDDDLGVLPLIFGHEAAGTAPYDKDAAKLRFTRLFDRAAAAISVQPELSINTPAGSSGYSAVRPGDAAELV
jgi:hypothetical protein